MNGLLNIGSVSLGLCAWMIPIAILLNKNTSQRSAIKGIVSSFVCALLSLLMQMMETKQLIARNDWSALLDTQGAVVFGAIVLIVVVAVLNGIVRGRLSNPGVLEEGPKRSCE